MSTRITITSAGAGDFSDTDTLTKHLERLEVEDIKTDGDAGSDSSYGPRDESRSNGDSTENTSPDTRELPRPHSPVSKGGVPDMSWEAAQLLLHHRLFFWNYKFNQPPQMYCWCIAYTPIAMSIEAESQLWHARHLHSRFNQDQAILMGHRLVLPSRSCDPRTIYKHPENSLVLLYEDIMLAHQEWATTSNLVSTDPVLSSLGNYRVPSNPGQNSQVPDALGSSIPVKANETIPDEVEMRMDLGNARNPTEDQVKAFAADFRNNGAGRGASVVICLHCPHDSGRRRITDPRPWNLKRHLMSHFRNGGE